MLAVALGGMAAWMGMQNNNQGEYFDTLTGNWDIGYIAGHFIAPLMAWTLVFAVGGGFRRSQSACGCGKHG